MKREEVSKIPTKIRIYANSKLYHNMIKGIDDQTIFYDDQDRRVFLKYLKLSQEKFQFNIYSYCLMSNHVHLVMKSEKEFLSKSIQSLLIRYVNYFNKKYKRKGHLVQDRFKSKIIESQKYFLDVCRYVHRNPEKAGITKTQNYKWSSYNAYINGSDIVDTRVLLSHFNNDIKEFIKFTTKQNDINKDIEEIIELAEYEMISKLSDSQLGDIIVQLFDIQNKNELVSYFKSLSNMQLCYAIRKLKKIKGTNKTQIARVIRIERRIVEKYW